MMRPEKMNECRSYASDIGNRPYYDTHSCHCDGYINLAMDYKDIGAWPEATINDQRLTIND